MRANGRGVSNMDGASSVCTTASNGQVLPSILFTKGNWHGRGERGREGAERGRGTQHAQEVV